MQIIIVFIFLKKGVNHADITIDNIQDKCYFIGDQANSNNFITEFDFRFGPYFIPNKVGTNKKADYNWIRDNNGQDTNKAVRVLLLGGRAHGDSPVGSGAFYSHWVRSDSNANGLKVKDNYQIYPVDSKGINFVGYVFYHTHTLIRKSIKYKIIRLVNSYLNREIDRKEFKVRMCAYYGWLKHANTKNLLYKIQSLTGVRYSNWDGKRTNITKYYGKYVRIIQVINYAKYFRINFIKNGKAYYADSRDKTLFYSIHRLNHFPINFKITKYDWRIYAKNRKEKVKLKT